MGYRNYFAIVEKEKMDEFLKLSEEDRVRFSWEKDLEKNYMDQEEVDHFVELNYINSFVFKYAMGGEEIHECGKYFDNETAEKIKDGSVNLSNEDGELKYNTKDGHQFRISGSRFDNKNPYPHEVVVCDVCNGYGYLQSETTDKMFPAEQKDVK